MLLINIAQYKRKAPYLHAHSSFLFNYTIKKSVFRLTVRISLYAYLDWTEIPDLENLGPAETEEAIQSQMPSPIEFFMNQFNVPSEFKWMPEEKE